MSLVHVSCYCCCWLSFLSFNFCLLTRCRINRVHVLCMVSLFTFCFLLSVLSPVLLFVLSSRQRLKWKLAHSCALSRMHSSHLHTHTRARARTPNANRRQESISVSVATAASRAHHSMNQFTSKRRPKQTCFHFASAPHDRFSVFIFVCRQILSRLFRFV